MHLYNLQTFSIRTNLFYMDNWLGRYIPTTYTYSHPSDIASSTLYAVIYYFLLCYKFYNNYDYKIINIKMVVIFLVC